MTTNTTIPPTIPAGPKPVGATNTGLDLLVTTITDDPGLIKKIPLADIYGGATAADGMNKLIVEAIRATGIANNGDITAADVYDLNAYIRKNHLAEWTKLHGDDEDCEETGFHLVQNDGATSKLYDRNAVNTVADGLYHLGFEIKDGQLLNEDGNANASVKTVAQWLNDLLATDLTGSSLKNTSVDPYAEGTTNTGLDQLVTIITTDEGLNKKIATSEIFVGATAADGMNKLIVEAIRATGIANNGDITAADVYDLNAYIRKNHLAEWTKLHGDDEDCEETGFHLVQNDGATSRLYDRNAVNTVADGLYHLGFQIKDGELLNEDGNANASIKTVAQWLDDLLDKDLAGGTLKNASVDPYVEGTTNTGLDQLVTIITTDEGLNKKIATSEIFAGATAADGMNKLIVEAIRATGIANNGDITAADVYDLNAYIRKNHLAEWTKLHGDDEDCAETGFHLVQNDGATSRLYDRNAVNTVADGLYHLGFQIKDGELLNEDGNANASIKTVAQWLSDLLVTDLSSGSLKNASVDPYAKGTTNTGLDQLVTIITTDEGLNKKIATSEIFAGATAANEMNDLIVEAIRATGAADGKLIEVDELREINAYIRKNHLAEWTTLHGDDEGGEETGFHLVQNDGATSKLFDHNAVNTVADGLYHIGFEIQNNRFLNEDGNANASLKSVAEWLNSLLAEDLASGELLTPVVNSANDASAITLVGVASLVEGIA